MMKTRPLSGAVLLVALLWTGSAAADVVPASIGSCQEKEEGDKCNGAGGVFGGLPGKCVKHTCRKRSRVRGLGKSSLPNGFSELGVDPPWGGEASESKTRTYECLICKQVEKKRRRKPANQRAAAAERPQGTDTANEREKLPDLWRGADTGAASYDGPADAGARDVGQHVGNKRASTPESVEDEQTGGGSLGVWVTLGSLIAGSLLAVSAHWRANAWEDL